MKERRRLFLVAMGFTLLFGLYTGENIFFIGFFVLLFMLLLGVFTGFYALWTLKYDQDLSPTSVIKGRSVTYRIRIYNNSFFPLTHIKITYSVPDASMNQQLRSALFSILPGCSEEICEKIDCSYWGQYSIGICGVEVRDIFGLVTFTSDMFRIDGFRKETLLVYPQVLSLNDMPITFSASDGQLNRKLQATSEPASLSDIRSYRYGDPLQRIHWKLSAHRQELMVKNYEDVPQPEMILFIDCSLHLLAGLDKIRVEDKLIETIIAVAYYTLSHWLPLRAVAYTESRHELKGKKPGDFPAFYELFATLSFTSRYAIDDILFFEMNQLQHSSHILLATHQLSERLFEILLLFRQTGMEIFLLLVIAEKEKSHLLMRMLEELTDNGIHTMSITPDDDLSERMETIS